MKTFAELKEHIELLEFHGNIHDSHVSDDDVYEFARHVDNHAKAHGLARYPAKDESGKELEHGHPKHRAEFFSDPLNHESHRNALRELQSAHRAHGTVPKDGHFGDQLGRRSWHHAASKKLASDPDWGKKENTFAGNRGKPVGFSKKKNVEAGPSTKGLHKALLTAGVHPKAAKDYVDLDKHYDKKFIGGYASFSKNRYAKYRKFPGQK